MIRPQWKQLLTVDKCKLIILLLHISALDANGPIYISRQFANKSQWLQGDSPAFVGICKYFRPFIRFCEY